jgi:hypothetical protein
MTVSVVGMQVGPVLVVTSQLVGSIGTPLFVSTRNHDLGCICVPRRFLVQDRMISGKIVAFKGVCEVAQQRRQRWCTLALPATDAASYAAAVLEEQPIGDVLNFVVKAMCAYEDNAQ